MLWKAFQKAFGKHLGNHSNQAFLKCILKAFEKADGRFSFVLMRGRSGKHGKRNVCVLHFANGSWFCAF